MGVSCLTNCYLTQIKIYRKTRTKISHVFGGELLFDSNKDTGGMTSVVAQGDSQSLSVADK